MPCLTRQTEVLISCLAGPLVGHHIFVTEMSGYWMHKSGVTYKDVAGSPAAWGCS